LEAGEAVLSLRVVELEMEVSLAVEVSSLVPPVVPSLASKPPSLSPAWERVLGPDPEGPLIFR
jgi:hypothetical protein